MRHARLTRGDLVNYAGVAGDANPIHWDEDIAKLASLPDVIAHGMLTMGLGAGFASTWTGDPGAVTRYSVRLSAPAIVSAKEGCDIEFSGKIKSLDPETRSGVVIVAREIRWQEDLWHGHVGRPLQLTGGRQTGSNSIVQRAEAAHDERQIVLVHTVFRGAVLRLGNLEVGRPIQ